MKNLKYCNRSTEDKMFLGKDNVQDLLTGLKGPQKEPQMSKISMKILLRGQAMRQIIKGEMRASHF